jgi:hypothetical protein
MSESRSASVPAAPSQIPGFPENFGQFVFEEFETLNTKPLRPGIKDAEMYWCDGWMPLGPNNLRILWGTGAPLFTAPSGTTVEWFGFGNVFDVAYLITLLLDGSIRATNVLSGMTTQIAAPGTIIDPSSIFGFSQWGSQYLIFTKDQNNGYWLWDGTNLYTAGTASPEVTLTNGGQNYTSPPTITVYTNGAGTGAAFSAIVENGAVTQVTCTDPGSGYAVDDMIVLFFTGGGSDDSCIATCNVSGPTSGGVSSVTVTAPGAGYSGDANLQFVGGGGSGATAAVVIGGGNGIESVAMISQGTGYTSPPGLDLNDPGHTGNSYAAGFATIVTGQLLSLNIISPGSGYTSAPVVTIIGDGENAVVQAIIQNGQVTSFEVTSGGFGYTWALAVISGGNNSASATSLLMPFGISGTAAEVYQGSVWVANGAAVSNTPPKNRGIFSAPGSPVNFGPPGGAFASTDSFLRIGFHSLKQSNGFLYLIADSSMNYVSGTQTSSSGSASVAAVPITTFGDQNVDPQLGSPWPSSVQVFSRNIVFANTIGIFVSYGGAVTKVSTPLDGFYGSGPIYGNQANYSSAVADIFNVPIYMLLLPVVDPFTGQQANKLLMWDGKRWFTSQQDRALTYIASQELNSVLTAWGTDGTSVFPLFNKPSTGFAKTTQSKLFSPPGYFYTKTGLRLHGVANSYVIDEPLTITIDNENGLGVGNAELSVTPEAGAIEWFNNLGQPINWGSLVWGAPGLQVIGPIPAGQNGRLLGLTVQTTASDMALLSLMVTGQNYTPNL